MSKSSKELGQIVFVLHCFCKVHISINDFGYLAEISKQRVEGALQLLLIPYSKMQEERNELKIELLNKKEPEFKVLENCQPIQNAANTKGVVPKQTGKKGVLV